ncbi:MAG TPA: MBL fold metallo-hydrolase [Gemmatimonadaceae bacterium]|jgi:glyoxylase-like metal-dependent hydrolase (beta-lactamase superfamily II)
MLSPSHSNAQTNAPRAPAASSVPEWCARLPRPEYAQLERVAVPSTWFEVYRVEPGVYAIYEPHQWQEIISWLVVGSHQALLFDTGMGMHDIHAVATSLTQVPIEVLNSHTHNDHVGDNWRFTQVLGLDDPFTKHNQAGYSHSEVASEVTPSALCGEAAAGLDTAAYFVRPFHITSFVHDGSRIELGGRTLEVLRVPGHAPDAIALFDRANGLLFTGDTFYEGPIYVYAKGADLAAFTRSTARLAALVPGLRKVLASHNVAVSDPALLVKLRDAAKAVAKGTVVGNRDGALVTYSFDRFSLVVPDAVRHPTDARARVP